MRAVTPVDNHQIMPYSVFLCCTLQRISQFECFWIVFRPIAHINCSFSFPALSSNLSSVLATALSCGLSVMSFVKCVFVVGLFRLRSSGSPLSPCFRIIRIFFNVRILLELPLCAPKVMLDRGHQTVVLIRLSNTTFFLYVKHRQVELTWSHLGSECIRPYISRSSALMTCVWSRRKENFTRWCGKSSRRCKPRSRPVKIPARPWASTGWGRAKRAFSPGNLDYEHLKRFVNVRLYWNLKRISKMWMLPPRGKISADAHV